MQIGIVVGKAKGKGLCCGGHQGPARLDGHKVATVKVHYPEMAVKELMVPCDRLPRITTAKAISYDETFFTNARLFEDDEEQRILCCVFNPFGQQVVLFTPGAGEAQYTEGQAAGQLYEWIRNGASASETSRCTANGSDCIFSGITGSGSVAPLIQEGHKELRTLNQLEGEFWLVVLILQALLGGSATFSISAAAVSALRVCMKPVSRAEKCEAVSNWAAFVGNPGPQNDLRAEREEAERVRMERQRQQIEQQKHDMEIRRQQMEMERQQLELQKEQRRMEAERAAMNRPVQQPVYQQQQCPPPYHNNNHHHRHSGGGNALGFGLGIGAGLLGALVLEEIFD